MATTLAPQCRLEQVYGKLDAIKLGLLEVAEQLQPSPRARSGYLERLAQLEVQLEDVRSAIAPDDFTSREVGELYENLWEVRDLIEQSRSKGDLDVIDRLVVCIERIRHVVRDALDERAPSEHADVATALAEIRRSMPHTPQAKLARLLDKTPRTLSRWANQTGAPSRRLELVTQLVAILCHNWTEEGIVAWFDRPREDLGGKKPITLLDDPGSEDRLIAAARSGRSQYAA